MKDFNGTTDVISLGSPAALDDIGGVNGARSVTAWIYPQGWGEGDFGRIWDKGTFSTIGWFLYLRNNVAPLASIQGVIGATTSANAIAAANTLSLNKRWFVAMSWAGVIVTNPPRLWVGDGATPVAEVSYDSTAIGSGSQGSDAAQTAYIGNRAAADRTFDGFIGHLSVWAGELTQSQLEHLRLFPYAPMHAFSGKTLKGYWPLNESAAATCLDHSGNGSNGTVTGTSVAAEPPFAWTRRGARATIWTPAAAGVTYPQLERSRRGLERGLLIGAGT